MLSAPRGDDAKNTIQADLPARRPRLPHIESLVRANTSARCRGATAYDPYDVWVSEVMLQQTRMEVVLGYYERFMTRFPDVAALAAASVDEVTAAWSGLGYYRRARMLRDGAVDVVTRFGGVIPTTVDELMTIAGHRPLHGRRDRLDRVRTSARRSSTATSRASWRGCSRSRRRSASPR